MQTQRPASIFAWETIPNALTALHSEGIAAALKILAENLSQAMNGHNCTAIYCPASGAPAGAMGMSSPTPDALPLMNMPNEPQVLPREKHPMGRSCLLVPVMTTDSGLLGVVQVVSSDAESIFTPDDLAYLEQLVKLSSPLFAYHRLNERCAQSANELAALRQCNEELEKTHRALQEQESLFRGFLNTSPAIAWMKDDEGRYVYFSRSYEQRVGIRAEDRLGKTSYDLWPADVAEKLLENDRKVLAADGVMEMIEETRSSEGKTIIWWNHKFPFMNNEGKRFVGGMGVDITDWKRSEVERLRLEQLVHLQDVSKLESLGVMAAGVASEFNNQLATIRGYVELALMDLSDKSEPAESLRGALKAINKANEATRQMSVYCGQARLVMQSLDLRKWLDEHRETFQILLGRNTLEYCMEDDVPTIHADPARIRQLLINLLTNAAEAIGEGEQGRVLVEVRRGFGTEVILSVSDNGCGMSEEIQGRIFDPFFSTKDATRGLGLSAVLGIVRSHQAAIDVTSEPGHGAMFRMRFLV
jgi:PAS domain S-box-containing protein